MPMAYGKTSEVIALGEVSNLNSILTIYNIFCMNSGKVQPSIDDLISLNVPALTKSSPGGAKVAYTVRTTNWNKNRYEHVLFVYHVSTGDRVQLTRGGDTTDFQWSGDASIITLRQEEGKAQVWLYEDLAGEPVQLTDLKTGVQAFKTAGDGVLFIADHPERSKRKALRDSFGNVTHFEEEESASTLYYTEPTRVKEYDDSVRKATEEEAKSIPKPFIEVSGLIDPMKIISFFHSHGRVYLNCRAKDPLVYSTQVGSLVLDIDLPRALELHMSGGEWSGAATKLDLPEQATIAAVSPDGSSLLVSYKGRDRLSYTQADIWHLELGSDLGEPQLPKMRKLMVGLDRGIMNLEWGPLGIYASYIDGTKTEYAKVALDGTVRSIKLGDIHGGLYFNVSKDGFLAFIGANSEKLHDVYVTTTPVTHEPVLIQVTDYNAQLEGWEKGVVETIEWTSVDGTVIQGVLRKPSDFDPSRKYPLLFDVHGGPSWFSREVLLEPYDCQRYPVVQFNNADVLILKPNYRGSIGRGQAFRELNVDNLGVGDLWDLESAIDHLDGLGHIDTERVGCMGWSQGGYISAFAGLRSNRFKAVCMGAGISDWYTYHISNDIPYFTDHYLSASPWDDREVYEKTAPITGIETADTPTLIQHGGKDMRVPLSNAMEVYRALKAKGVPVEMFVYPDMAHPITKPRECRAVMQQNLDWFMHYLVDPDWEPVPGYWDKDPAPPS